MRAGSGAGKVMGVSFAAEWRSGWPGRGRDGALRPRPFPGRPLARICPVMDGSGAPGALRIRKMHGLGNDFVVIDARDGLGPGAPRVTEVLARALGDRHRGVGFDQLAELLPGTQGADLDIVFWNADGSTAGACGNATRCVADLLMPRRPGATPSPCERSDALPAVRRADGLISVEHGRADLRAGTHPAGPGANPAALPLPASRRRWAWATRTASTS
jgi:hypothetical protein